MHSVLNTLTIGNSPHPPSTPPTPTQDRATRAQALKALTPKPSKPRSHEKRGARTAAVWQAIFSAVGLPDQFTPLLLFLAGYSKGQAQFEAFRGELARAFFAEDKPPGTQADLKRARLAQEQRFHDLLDSFLGWQVERGLSLVRYFPGQKVDGEAIRGTFHLPVLKLFSDVYEHSKSTSAFQYVREAKIREVARETVQREFREWAGTPQKPSRRLPAAKRIDRERKKLLSSLKRLTAELNPTTRPEFWAEISEVGQAFGLTLFHEEPEALDNSTKTEPPVYRNSDAFAENKEVTSQLGAPSCVPSRPITLGQPLPEFIARTTETRQQSEAQRRFEYVKAAYESSLSLAEVQNCNSHAPKGTGAWKQYQNCPVCGGAAKGRRGRFNVNERTGRYRCHYAGCEVKGKLREFWENPPTEWDAATYPKISRAEIEAKRQAQAEQAQAEQAAKIEAARNLYESAKPLAQAPAARDYVQQRTGAADVAERCGVRFTDYAGTEHEGKNRRAVVVALHDADGRTVATNDRQINDAWALKTFTTGAKDQGVFMTPGALDAARVMIVESPLDAIAVHACGFDAIALCGTSWPVWLLDVLEGKHVLLGQDNDQPDKRGQRAGDAAATRLANELVGRAFVQRARPSLKDWAEIAETRGLDALRAELAATGDDDVEVFEC